MWTVRYVVLWMILLYSGVGVASVSAFKLIKQNAFSYIGQPGNQQARLVVLGGYRIYNSGFGQFLKQDSYSPFRGKHTLNGFGYVAGNPILFVDRSGHLPMPLPTTRDDDSLAPSFSSERVRSNIADQLWDNVFSAWEENSGIAMHAICLWNKEPWDHIRFPPDVAFEIERISKAFGEVFFVSENWIQRGRNLRASHDLGNPSPEYDTLLTEVSTGLIRENNCLVELCYDLGSLHEELVRLTTAPPPQPEPPPPEGFSLPPEEPPPLQPRAIVKSCVLRIKRRMVI